MLMWLRNRLEQTEEKLAQTEASLDEREHSLTELREAYNALPSPKDVEQRLESQRTELETEKLKTIAAQKQKHAKEADKWKESLLARKREIERVQEEARVIAQRCEAERIARESLSQQLSNLESRGFFARLFNRKYVVTD